MCTPQKRKRYFRDILLSNIFAKKNKNYGDKGGSPGLVVKGRDTRSKGCGFDPFPGWTFFHIYLF